MYALHALILCEDTRHSGKVGFIIPLCCPDVSLSLSLSVANFEA